MWSTTATVVLALVAFVCHSAQAAFEKEYVVIIEASMGDTLGSCYSFKRRDAVGDPVEDLEVLGRRTVRTEPLHHFASVGRLTEVKSQVQPIVDFCLEQIPKESQQYTPVYVLLGGGVRALNGALQSNLITVIHQVVRLSCFRVGTEAETVIMLSAQEEAAYAYLGLNFVDNRGNDRVSQLLVDLGAAVGAQGLRAGINVEHTVPLKDLENRDFNVYAPVLEFDGSSPLNEHLRNLPADVDTRQPWPCFPQGYEVEMLVIRRGTGTGVRFTVIGSSDPVACEDILSNMLKEQIANAQPFVAEGFPQRNLQRGTYNALGALETAITQAAAGERVTTPEKLLSGTKTLCRRTWPEQIDIASSTATPESVANQCTNAMWVSLVLRDAVRAAGVNLSVQSVTKAFRSGAAPGFVISNAQTMPVGAPPRGIRCDELSVHLKDLRELPRLVLYQCDCVTFTNYQPKAVHYISSDPLLREVMPQFASTFLYPESFTKMDPVKYPMSHRVCSTTATPIGKYNYHCDIHEQQRMNGTIIIREQRSFGNE